MDVCVLFYWQIYIWEGLGAVIYNHNSHWALARLDWSPWLCVSGDRAVWPPAQRPAETVSAALPVLQPPAPDQSAVPLPHLGLLQQRPQQGDPAAGDELRAAGFLHSGKHPDFKTVIKPQEG